MGWIYKVTNQVNGKMYIGKTEESNPLKRWDDHKQDYKRKRMEKRPFYDALKCYGIENFEFEVIDPTDDSEKLCELERYYIDMFRTYVGFEDCKGYNATLGGDGKKYLNLDEDEVIRIHIENKYIVGRTANIFNCDPNSIQKILEKHNIMWLSNNEITKMKFKEQYGGVVQINNEKNVIIKIYECPKDVYDEHPDFQEKGLSDAYRLHHKTHKYKNSFWYRLYELPDEYKPLLKEYYATHIYEDSLEIDDNLEYLY